MASKVSIAMTRDCAVASLMDSGQQIAEALGIAPPELTFFYRDKELQQAEELRALAAFQMNIQAALRIETPSKKKVIQHAKS